MKISPDKIFPFFFLLLYSFATYPQNKTIDSLKKILQTEKEDTNRVNTLNELSSASRQNNDGKNAMLYANEAMSLAEKINFNKGLVIMAMVLRKK